MDKIPVLATDLIDYLDHLYPEKSPEGHEPERELWMAAGARQLVRILLLKRKAVEKETYDFLTNNSDLTDYED